jgi:hypothetical protein
VFTESHDESQSDESEDKKDNKDKVISKMSYIIEYILLINDYVLKMDDKKADD